MANTSAPKPRRQPSEELAQISLVKHKRVVQLWLIPSGNAAYAEYFSDVVNAVSAAIAQRNTWLILWEVQHGLISDSLTFNPPPFIQTVLKNAQTAQ